VLTVHDTLNITHKQQFGPRHRLWELASRSRQQIHNATLVLANSAHTRTQLLQHTNVAESAIRVIPLGIDDHYFDPCPDTELTRVLAKHGLRAGYVLHLGTIEPRKNVGSLLKAFGVLHRRRPDLELVLAGGLGAGSKRTLGQGPLDGVRVLGHVDSGDKRALYTAAGVYCSISHAEGFGLTPLEALACGTPAVVSDIPSLRESLNRAGAMFVEDREDVREIALALERLLSGEAERSAILERAPMILAKYRWDTCAHSTYQAIRDAVADGRRAPRRHVG
jgi:glycosyltransferase involved in cell wall biosynthesis